VPVDIAAVGNVEAYISISVRSQVTGQLQQAFFHEGDSVKKGDRLFQIDPRPARVGAAASRGHPCPRSGAAQPVQAQLDRDASNAEYQQVTAARQAQLVAGGLLSKDAGDQARAAADATVSLIKADKAAVDSARAQLAVQQSMVDNAKVLLSYTDIRFADRWPPAITPSRSVTCTANNTELVTVDQLQPVYVTFAVPRGPLAGNQTARREGRTESFRHVARGRLASRSRDS